MDAKDKVRVGFIGSGFMGQKAHLDNFVAVQDCEIVALAEGREKTRARKLPFHKVTKVRDEGFEQARSPSFPLFI